MKSNKISSLTLKTVICFLLIFSGKCTHFFDFFKSKSDAPQAQAPSSPQSWSSPSPSENQKKLDWLKENFELELLPDQVEIRFEVIVKSASFFGQDHLKKTP